ncbi:MAG: ABC transporter ATP-binding protein, partial [Candidatus Bathyarchaeota archaeon]|nr:ABC transporter ATP-binding protein [Candidatus Bathyarchaeota archaeon]
MATSPFSIFIKDLVTEYTVEKRSLKAVEGVDLQIKEGEVMGLAGESACGKSTLAYSILRLLPANGHVTQGEIQLNGKNLINLTDEEFRRVRWTELSIIFQGAMNALNPCMTITDQISEAIRAHEEIGKEEANGRSINLLSEVGISERFSQSFPHELSGGMKQRVMIAMALGCDPSFLIADEPTTALDLIAQRNVLQVMRNIQERMSLSVLLISHDLSVIAQMADRCTIMYAGKVVETGQVNTIFNDAIHPYTQALVNAFPDIRSTKKIDGISGDPPDMMNPPNGCRFHPRCSLY